MRAENGVSPLDARNPYVLAKAPGVDAASFFRAETFARRTRAITKAGAGERGPTRRCDLEPRRAESSARHPAAARSLKETGGSRAREGEGFLYIREAAIYTDPRAPAVMETRDSMHFDGNTAQAYPATDGGPAEMLVVTTVDHG